MAFKSFTTHLTEAFTRQHYQAVAAVLKKSRQGHTSSDAVAAVEMITDELAQMFAKDNPSFRADQFKTAAGSTKSTLPFQR